MHTNVQERSILIVDDDRGNCEVVAEMLTSAGYDCEVAYGARQALEILSDAPQRFVMGVFDYQMPEMNGVELYRRILQTHPDFIGLFLTAFARIDTVFPAISAGAERVLAKPISANELVPLVEEFVGPPG